MEEDDDEFYGHDGTANAPGSGDQSKQDASANGQANNKDDNLDEELESGEEEEEGSDSDIEIITDRPQAQKPMAQSTVDSIKDPRATDQTSSRSQTHQQQSAPKTTLSAPTAPSAPQQPGSSYPEVRTSTINVNADPVYPPVGKPISQTDIDADLAENTKPWRLPGADQSDYFNYGFDEFTWEMYRQRQATMTGTLATQKAETAQFQQMFGGATSVPSTSPAPPVPGAPTGPAAQQASMANPMAAMMGMPGMPSSQEEMATAMQAVMMQQGITDPSQLDFNTFMASFQQQMAGGGMPGQQAPQQQQQAQAQSYGQGYGNYAQQQGGGQQYGGRGQGGRGGGRRW